MPRSLSKFGGDPDVFFGPGAARQSIYAGHSLAVISCWSQIEADRTGIFSKVMRAEIQTAVSVYLSLTGRNREKAMNVAAKEALPEWQATLIRAVFKASEPSYKDRNEFAHSIWGYSPNLPESAVLLIPPESMGRHLTSIRETLWDTVDRKLDVSPLDNEKIMVWQRDDFDYALQSAYAARDRHSLLFGVIGDHIEPMRRQLLREAGVREALDEMLAQKSYHHLKEQLKAPMQGEPPPSSIRKSRTTR